MNIQPISNNNISMGKTPKKPNPKSFINRIKQNILDASPNATFNDKDKIQRWVKFYEQMSRPDINRVVMGGTAFFLQPAIDASNKKVDDDTRKVSICRTIAKIITGTSVGIIVRGSAYKAVEKMTDINGVKPSSKSLLPKKYITELSKDPKLLTNYRSALSTAIAIGAMCITNFVIDAPITTLLTNKFIDAANLNKSKEVCDEKCA